MELSETQPLYTLRVERKHLTGEGHAFVIYLYQIDCLITCIWGW